MVAAGGELDRFHQAPRQADRRAPIPPPRGIQLPRCAGHHTARGSRQAIRKTSQMKLISSATLEELAFYTAGDCHHLAIARARRFGWQIHAVPDNGDPHWWEPARTEKRRGGK